MSGRSSQLAQVGIKKETTRGLGQGGAARQSRFKAPRGEKERKREGGRGRRREPQVAEGRARKGGKRGADGMGGP
jgi:hypothetical protein